MKPAIRISLYFASLLGLAFIIYFVFSSGKVLETGIKINPAKTGTNTEQLVQVFTDAMKHPLAIFLFQLVLIISFSQLCAFLFRKIGQPTVMGEIIAGILLGPSFVGAIMPQFSAFVFPPASLTNLQVPSQVGLILFMFVIGIELDIKLLREKAGTAVFVSYFSIIVPFGMGICLSYFLYKSYPPANIPFYAFSLFIGIAMSITAFPVLARIIRERGIGQTRLGTIAISAAASNDIAAWCILAFIVAIAKAGTVLTSIYTLGAVVLYVVVMLYIIKPILDKLAILGSKHNILRPPTLAFIFVVLLLSSYCCEVIGIHALFGAFFAGAILPRKTGFSKVIIDKIEDVAMVLLLPLFFVFTGLRTQVGLLNDVALWASCGFIILVAVAGKFGGSAIAARICGESVKDSLSIGALMNTRGLVELVVLNIGYDLGILTPQVFTMLVLMAIITTLTTNPALNLINKWYK